MAPALILEKRKVLGSPVGFRWPKDQVLVTSTYTHVLLVFQCSCFILELLAHLAPESLEVAAHVCFVIAPVDLCSACSSERT